MYGVVGAVAIPVWTLRHWRELGCGRRIIYVLVAVFCLGMRAQTLWLAIQLRRS